ncbi:hypothetical protein IAU59_005371 [Kwoniella sp. CBS 9459]
MPTIHHVLSPPFLRPQPHLTKHIARRRNDTRPALSLLPRFNHSLAIANNGNALAHRETKASRNAAAVYAVESSSQVRLVSARRRLFSSATPLSSHAATDQRRFPSTTSISSPADTPNRPQHQRRSQLNVLAHFKPPPPRTPLIQVLSPDGTPAPGLAENDQNGGSVLGGKDKESRPARTDEAFETSSTSPAGSSLQDVPKPVSISTSSLDDTNSAAGTKLVEPIPAMKDPVSSIYTPGGGGLRPSAGTRTKEIAVQGVMVPPKPTPPGEEDCCMSGCVHCVYTIYADDLEAYSDAVVQARQALLKAGIPQDSWPIPDELVERPAKPKPESESELGADSRSKGVRAQAQSIVVEETKKVESGLDPTMSAFLALENKLKKKQAPESSAAS